MKTFTLDGGDLALGQSGYALVEGSLKLRQDLAVALREPFGCDRFHPRWGSLLYDYVGMIAHDEAAILVRGEITRLLQNYIHIQGNIMAADVAAGRKSRFSRGEMIQDLKGIDIAPELDRFKVRVQINTMSNDQVTLTQTVR